MALIDLKLNPSDRDLNWFGVLALLFFAVVGALVAVIAGMVTLAIVLWSVGLAFTSIYYLVRPLRLVMYRGWLRLFQPVGWVISHALLAVIYYGVFTLIGLGLRIFGYDPMRRRRDLAASTYWLEHEAAPDSSRYFRQF